MNDAQALFLEQTRSQKQLKAPGLTADAWLLRQKKNAQKWFN